MQDTKALQAERQQLRDDFLLRHAPRRVPVYPTFSLELACGLAGISLRDANSDDGLAEKAYDTLCATFYADALPFIGARLPAVYEALGAKNWVMASGGSIQHPEIETMRPEDYDDFIAAPWQTVYERFLPRVCTKITGDAAGSKALTEALQIYNDRRAYQKGIFDRLRDAYGFGEGLANCPRTEAPFDFLADQLRGFKGVTMDLRRAPEKVEAAVRAILPLMVRCARPPALREGLYAHIPLHMAPYMNAKQFERFFWPTLEKLVVTLDAIGIGCILFAEQDWTRYTGYLERLPPSSCIQLENGDPAHFAATVGQSHSFGGGWDPTISLVRSRQECLDDAKRFVDAGMACGKFYFGFDRNVMDIRTIDVGKVQAVLEWVRDYAIY